MITSCLMVRMMLVTVRRQGQPGLLPLREPGGLHERAAHLTGRSTAGDTGLGATGSRLGAGDHVHTGMPVASANFWAAASFHGRTRPVRAEDDLDRLAALGRGEAGRHGNPRRPACPLPPALAEAAAGVVCAPWSACRRASGPRQGWWSRPASTWCRPRPSRSRQRRAAAGLVAAAAGVPVVVPGAPVAAALVPAPGRPGGHPGGGPRGLHRRRGVCVALGRVVGEAATIWRRHQGLRRASGSHVVASIAGHPLFFACRTRPGRQLSGRGAVGRPRRRSRRWAAAHRAGPSHPWRQSASNSYATTGPAIGRQADGGRLVDSPAHRTAGGTPFADG